MSRNGALLSSRRNPLIPPTNSSCADAMALVSMTGFADARGLHNGLRWRWEAKSVNGRGLDLRFRIPPGFDGLEAGARTLASERFKRGSLQVALTTASEESGRGFRVDPVALADAVRI